MAEKKKVRVVITVEVADHATACQLVNGLTKHDIKAVIMSDPPDDEDKSRYDQRSYS